MGIELVYDIQNSQLTLIARSAGAYNLVDFVLPLPLDNVYIHSDITHGTNTRNITAGINIVQMAGVPDAMYDDFLERLSRGLARGLSVAVMYPVEGTSIDKKYMSISDDTGQITGRVDLDPGGSLRIHFLFARDSDAVELENRLESQIKICIDVLNKAIEQMSSSINSLNYLMEIDEMRINVGLKPGAAKRAVESEPIVDGFRTGFVEKLERDILQRWDIKLNAALSQYNTQGHHLHYRESAVENIRTAFEMLMEGHYAGLAENREEMLAKNNGALIKLRGVHSILEESSTPLDIAFTESLAVLIGKLEQGKPISDYPYKAISRVLERINYHTTQKRKMTM